MSLLHPALIYGLGLAALPVILHFLMKQKPKRVIFPALKLIQSRQKQNSRRFRLRHWWLLLLRVGVLGLLVFALTRPSLPPANYNFSGLECGVLSAIIAAGMGTYFMLIHRWRKQGVAKPDLIERRSKARVWTTTTVLALLLLCVGWPYQRRVMAELKDPRPMAALDLPVAAVCLFDTSQSTSYTQEGKTRLDLAKAIAKNHLGDLPAISRVAITDCSGDNPIIFQSTLRAAQTRIETLEPRAVAIPLNERLRSALQAQADDRRRTLEEQGAIAEESRRDRFIRRVYILTDLAKSAWSAGVSQALKADLDRHKEVDVYLIDIGEEQPQNVGITQISLSRERISVGGSLDVQATIASTGIAEEMTVKLSILNSQERLDPRDEARVKITPNTPLKIDFQRLKGLTGPVVHGVVQIDRSDPLSADNMRFFTAFAGPPTPVLVVTSQANRAREIRFGLAPFDVGSAETNVFEPSVVIPAQLTEALIQKADVIWLQDLPRLPDATWNMISKHVEQGHGLVVTLGDDKIDSVAYDRTAAQVCLPASLDRWKPKADYRLQFSASNRVHPVFSEYREQEKNWAVLENNVRISRFWVVKPAGGASVLATYNDKEQSPAILEKSHGKGRVLMFTSGTHLPNDPVEQGQSRWDNRWSNFPDPLLDSWMWIAFVQQLADYGAGGGIEQFNHVCGEEVTLSLTPHAAERQLLFREPGLRQTQKTIPPDGNFLTVIQTETAGAYTLLEGADSVRPLTGFSVNLKSNECDLTRLTADDLNEILGPDRYQLARSIEELKSHIRSSDLGQEVFPILLVALLVFFCGEHLVANRFYQEE